MQNPQFQLFTDRAVLYRTGPKLLSQFFKRAVHFLGGTERFGMCSDVLEFAMNLPNRLQNHAPPESILRAVREVEALAEEEKWPPSGPRDFDAPEDSESYRLYKALHRWLEQHPETQGAAAGEPAAATRLEEAEPALPTTIEAPPALEAAPDSRLPKLTVPAPLAPEEGLSDGDSFGVPPLPAAEAAPDETDDQTFSRLARLSAADYDRVRSQEATRLRIRGVTLDKEVRRRRAELEDDTQAQTVKLPVVEPWPEPMLDAPGLFDHVAERFTLRIVLPAGGATAIVLWLAHTHCLSAFHLTPRLNLLSPRGGCGKTTTLELLATMVPRPFSIDNLRPAVLFRVVHLQQPTLLLDELDTYLRRMTELRGLLNAGHRSGSHAYRCEGPGNAVRGFRAYAAAALAGIGALPPTLRDRSIRIPLVEAGPGEIRSPLDRGNTRFETELGRKVARWAKDNFAAIKAAQPALPEAAHNRVADNWRPLFSIAEVIGGEWPALAARAFESLNTPSVVEEPGLMLLADIRQVFSESGGQRQFSAELVNALCALPNRPYADAWGRNGNGRRLDEAALARALSLYGVRSRNVRINSEQAKGYELADLSDAFLKFLGAKGREPVGGAETAAGRAGEAGDCGAVETEDDGVGQGDSGVDGAAKLPVRQGQGI